MTTSTSASERAATPASTAPTVEGWGSSLLRASGVVLFVLLPIQVVTMFVTTDVARHNADALALRWQSSTWRAVDWAVVVLALAHGTIGVRRLLVAGLPRRRALADGLSIALTVVVSALALAVTVVAFSWELA